MEYIKISLEHLLGSAVLYKGGITVFTTLSFKLQMAAEQAVENGLLALEKRMKQCGTREPCPQCALISLDVNQGKFLRW